MGRGGCDGALISPSYALLLSCRSAAAYVAVDPLGRIVHNALGAPSSRRQPRPSFLHRNALDRARTTPASSSSPALSMGFVEEFMSGRDNETRRLANEEYLAGLRERVAWINALEEAVEE